MRKVIGILSIIGLVGAMALVSGETRADCGATTTQEASNSGLFTGGTNTAYLNFPDAVDSSTFSVRWWQTNIPANNEGTVQALAIGAWFQDPYPGFSTPDDFTFRFDSDAAGSQNCIVGCMTLYVEDYRTGHFVMWTVPQGGVNSADPWDYTQINGSAYGAVPSGLSPRARVTLSGRAGAIVNVNYDVPNVAAGVAGSGGTSCGGFNGAVTGRRVFIQQSPTAPSTTLPGGWVQEGLDATGASPASARTRAFDCTNTASDWWIATGLLVDGQAPRFVSQPVQVECDPNLADPHGGFKKIDRPVTPRTQGRD